MTTTLIAAQISPGHQTFHEWRMKRSAQFTSKEGTTEKPHFSTDSFLESPILKSRLITKIETVWITKNPTSELELTAKISQTGRRLKKTPLDIKELTE